MGVKDPSCKTIVLGDFNYPMATLKSKLNSNFQVHPVGGSIAFVNGAQKFKTSPIDAIVEIDP